LELARQARLGHPALRFHVVGYTDIDQELRAVGNVTITGPYRSEELGRLVDKTRGRVALFLHEWPETFSYTLTEAWSLGLWPIVRKLGAPAERVTDKKDGSVVDVLDISALADILGLVERVGSNGSGQAVALSHDPTPIDITPLPTSDAMRDGARHGRPAERSKRLNG
jgi:glycosyltransferase involved in cell wall biosynthesis